MVRKMILMKKKVILWSLFCGVVWSCENKRRYAFEFEQAPITILGQEHCRLAADENAWIINVSPYGQKRFGVPLTFKGRVYGNVVKVHNYHFVREYADSTFSYFADFYNEETPAKPCEVVDPVVYQVPVIRIKAVVKSYRKE